MKRFFAALTMVLLLFATAGAAHAATSRHTRPRVHHSAVLSPQAGWWYSDVENVPTGSMGCAYNSGTPTANALRLQWGYWDQCGGSVVSAATEGLPTPPNGDTVVKWHKGLGDGNVYQKLYRGFTAASWPGPSDANTGSPADVSGRYIVNQYIPSSAFTLNPGHGWVVLNEFKENYLDGNGNFHQDPTWGLGCNDFSGTITCSLTPHNAPTFNLANYMNRWVAWEYRLYQGAKDTTGHGGRIELYADGVLLDTGYNSEMHVGSAAFVPLSQTQSWNWIAGQYTSNQTTNGVPDYQNTDVTSYIDSSQNAPLTAAGLKGDYFPTVNLTGTPTTRTDSTINFDWGQGSPLTGFPYDNFSVRWTGYLTPTVSGNYTLSTLSDDGARLWLNGVQEINAWFDQGATNHDSPVVALTAGTSYPLTVEYYEHTGGASMKLSWAGPFAKTIVAANYLNQP